MAAGKTFRFTSVIERSDNKLWGAHFVVPSAVVKKLTDGKSRRVSCSLNGTEPFQCAMLPFGNGTYVVSVNKKLRDALRLSFGSPVNVALEQDRSKYGLPMPEELAEVLKQDKEGNRLFHSLTAGKIRTLLYIVGSAKNVDAKIYRSIVILKHLKEFKGTIHYRQLNAALKKR